MNFGHFPKIPVGVVQNLIGWSIAGMEKFVIKFIPETLTTQTQVTMYPIRYEHAGIEI